MLSSARSCRNGRRARRTPAALGRPTPTASFIFASSKSISAICDHQCELRRRPLAREDRLSTVVRPQPARSASLESPASRRRPSAVEARRDRAHSRCLLSARAVRRPQLPFRAACRLPAACTRRRSHVDQVSPFRLVVPPSSRPIPRSARAGQCRGMRSAARPPRWCGRPSDYDGLVTDSRLSTCGSADSFTPSTYDTDHLTCLVLGQLLEKSLSSQSSALRICTALSEGPQSSQRSPPKSEISTAVYALREEATPPRRVTCLSERQPCMGSVYPCSSGRSAGDAYRATRRALGSVSVSAGRFPLNAL